MHKCTYVCMCIHVHTCTCTNIVIGSTYFRSSMALLSFSSMSCTKFTLLSLTQPISNPVQQQTTKQLILPSAEWENRPRVVSLRSALSGRSSSLYSARLEGQFIVTHIQTRTSFIWGGGHLPPSLNFVSLRAILLHMWLPPNFFFSPLSPPPLNFFQSNWLQNTATHSQVWPFTLWTSCTAQKFHWWWGRQWAHLCKPCLYPGQTAPSLGTSKLHLCLPWYPNVYIEVIKWLKVIRNTDLGSCFFISCRAIDLPSKKQATY